MASSSERGAARAPGAPPPPLPPHSPEEVAAFYALVEKEATASALNRHARSAELSDRAAKHAARLWGNNSLVVADLRTSEAAALRGMALASTSSSEQEALRQRAWAILVPVHALLLRRLEDNTLLPGTIKEEEVTYGARTTAFAFKASDVPVPPEGCLAKPGCCAWIRNAAGRRLYHAGFAHRATRLCAAMQECTLLSSDGVGRHSTNFNDAACHRE